MGGAVPLLARWVHIVSAIFLLGGVVFARTALRGRWTDETAAAWRPWALRAVVGLVAGGLYNFLAKASTPSPYHMVFGVKVLLAMHIIAIALLLGKPGVDESKRSRWISGVVWSGLAVTLLSAYLRWLTT
jgi:hypothetical protein